MSFNTYYILVDALFFMTGCGAIQALKIPPNLMIAHSWVHCGRGAWGVKGEKDGVGGFVGGWLVAKMGAAVSGILAFDRLL